MAFMTSPTSPLRVLLADDAPEILERLSLALSELEGVAEVVATAVNGPQLLALFDAHNPDVVITDLQMPGVRGFELIESLSSKDPNLRLIVLTMHDNAEIARRCITAGADHFLSKNDAMDLLPQILISYASI